MPMASVEPSVAVNVIVFDAVSVLPSAIASVALVAGAVIATLLIDVAEATPNVGVVKLGEINGAFKSSALCKSVWLLSVPVMLPHVPAPPPPEPFAFAVTRP